MQSYVATVGTERLDTGAYAYPVVIWTVPRQTGKTTGLRAIGTQRCLVNGRDVWYTAQTGKDARARWMDLVKIIRMTPALRDRVKVSLRGGSEAIEFLNTGAAFHTFAPTPESLHSYTPPMVIVDEAFAQTEMSGELLMGAIEPAQQTILDRQLWIVSTMGTAESVWLHEWIERARDGMPGVALFDWGAADDMDPYDPADIARFHPGVGFDFNGKVLTAEDVAAAADRVGRSEYERAYANRRTTTLTTLIPAEVVAALTATADPPPDPRALTLAYDVAFDRSSATIQALWTPTAGGPPHAKILQRRPGVAWLAPALRRYARDWRSTLTAADHGPVTEVTDDLTRAGFQVHKLPTGEWPTACTGFLNMVEQRGLTIEGEPELLAAIAGLATRNVGDQAAFSRRASVGDTSPAFALVAGLWHLTRRPAGRIVTAFRTSA